MEVKKTKDGSVYKFIHHDGSETAIKDVGGCSGLSPEASEKYSVFASCSYGCRRNCKFCMLHTKGVGYKRLEPFEVSSNMSQAFSYAVTTRPSLRKKKIKLAWMGMGEPALEIGPVIYSSVGFIEQALRRQCASGFDCLDIGTSFPSIPGYERLYFDLMDGLRTGFQTSDVLRETEDVYDRERPLVRLFVSVGSLQDETRKFLMGSDHFESRLDRLHAHMTSTWGEPNALICHLLLLEDANDSPEDVERFLQFFGARTDLELRLLRYNQCSGSPYQESPKFDEVSERFLKELPRVKVQTSPGSEVMAACGQFLV